MTRITPALTAEVSATSVGAVVFSPAWVVPFDAEPWPARPVDLANEADGAERAVKRKTTAYWEGVCHSRAFMRWARVFWRLWHGHA
jgi:hypothetical protein